MGERANVLTDLDRMIEEFDGYPGGLLSVRNDVQLMVDALKKISAQRITETGIPSRPDLSAEASQKLAEETLFGCGVYAK